MFHIKRYEQGCLFVQYETLFLSYSWRPACSSTTSLTDAELSNAATQGNGKAQYELAKRLASQPDYPNAMHWMQQAAEQSGPLAADEQVRANAAWHYYALLVVFFATTLPVVLSMRYCEIVPSKMW